MTVTNSGALTRRELQGISSDLKWSAVELARIAGRLGVAGNTSDAQAVLRMIQIFQQGEKRLDIIANQISDMAFVQEADKA